MGKSQTSSQNLPAGVRHAFISLPAEEAQCKEQNCVHILQVTHFINHPPLPLSMVKKQIGDDFQRGVCVCNILKSKRKIGYAQYVCLK